MKKSVTKRAKNVKLVIFDVDGVLTDGSLFFSGERELFKRFHVQDGMGIRLLHESEIQTAIITARESPIVSCRAKDLKITHVQQGVKNKSNALDNLLKQMNITEKECAFIGDDWVDLVILNRVGFAVAVANAREEVFPYAHYITSANGGNGAIREVCELILRAKNMYEKALSRYLP